MELIPSAMHFIFDPGGQVEVKVLGYLYLFRFRDIRLNGGSVPIYHRTGEL